MSKTSIGAGRLQNVRTGVVTAVACAVAVALAAFCAWQLSHYEDGLIETFANQQDDYVRVVAEQLSRASDEDAEALLGSVGPSSSKYWTMSEDGSLVFVKDVDDTSRYRGFSTSTYYDTDAAQAFVSGLSESGVTHAVIEVDGRDFIASGTVVDRAGAQVSLCLLTAKHVVIDQNAYLAARVGLGVAIGAALVLMVGACIVMGLRGDRLLERAQAAEADAERLRRTNERLGSQKLSELLGLSHGVDGEVTSDGGHASGNDENGEEGPMAHEVRRVYCFKSYLNASHYVSFDGKRGEVHPHTWQFSARVAVAGTANPRPFAEYERAIEAVFDPYQNKVVNECAPFDSIVPTLESLVEVFGEKVRDAIRGMDARLVEFGGSETPTRSYVLTYGPESDEPAPATPVPAPEKAVASERGVASEKGATPGTSSANGELA